MENQEKELLQKETEENQDQENIIKEEISKEEFSKEETKETTEDLGLSEEQEEKSEELPPMEAVAEVETVYDYRTLKYCNMYIIKIKKKSTLMYSVMAAICFIVGIVCFFTMEGINKYVALIIVGLGFWTLKNIFTEESKIDKSLETFFRTHAPFKQSFAFDHEKIRVTAFIDGEVKQADYPWPYIQEIHAIPEFFILFLNGGTPILIDRDESKLLQGTKEDLEQIIREQSVLKPFNVYNKPFVKNFKEIKYFTEQVEETTEVETSEIETSEEEK